MTEIIRNIRKDEIDAFMRFLDRSYGHQLRCFQLHCPDIYSSDNISLDKFHVIEKDGRIVSHVGLYPLDVISDGMRITIGGIGGVATLPEERCKGYMERLLLHVISLMEKQGLSVSVLWGERHRYRNFGWENAGEKMVLQFSERSLTKTGTEPISSIQEVAPHEAVSRVRQLYTRQRFYADRDRRLKSFLSRAGNRVWLCEDGYLCGGCAGDRLVVSEVVSLSGIETSFIMAVMQWCFVKEAEISICNQDTGYLNRLIGPAYNWSIRHEGMFRLNNCFNFLKHFIPVLEKRALDFKIGDFLVSLGIKFNDKIEIITVSYKSKKMRILKEKADPYIELDEREAVRLFIGRVYPDNKKELGIFSAILPLPIHIPDLDRI